jgi:hypothetical protein
VILIPAHFDGKVIVPDCPVDLPRNQALILQVEPVGATVDGVNGSSLQWLAEHAMDSPDLPADLSHQHDHYLYGAPKKDL